MIPKNLLSCWFGRGKRNALFEGCTETKRRVLPEWKLIEINEDTIDPELMSTPYMRGVLSRNEFVKATELGRLWGLLRHGGVYMDEDVEVIKPLDPLLGDPFFIGYEDAHTLNGAVIGSVPYGETIAWLKSNFPLKDDGMKKATHYGPLYLTAMLHTSDCKKYPPDYFYPYLYTQERDEARITHNTYAIHHWAGSWTGYK